MLMTPLPLLEPRKSDLADNALELPLDSAWSQLRRRGPYRP